MKTKTYKLTDTESVKIENLNLKDRLLKIEFAALQTEMNDLTDEIRKRINAPYNCDLNVSGDFKTVTIVEKTKKDETDPV